MPWKCTLCAHGFMEGFTPRLLTPWRLGIFTKPFFGVGHECSPQGRLRSAEAGQNHERIFRVQDNPDSDLASQNPSPRPRPGEACFWSESQRHENLLLQGTEVAKKMMLARAADWLEAAGIEIPRKTDGTPDCLIEIAPSFALYKEDVKTKTDRIPQVNPGDTIYLK